MGLLAPNPRKFFEKNLTKNFQMVYVLNCYPKYVRPTIILFLNNQRTNYLWKNLSKGSFREGAGAVGD